MRHINENKEKEGFLARWSRRKQQPQDSTPERPEPGVDPKAASPDLPPIETLTIESDFSPFFHPKVGEKVRQAALKKLFADPHFNVMDGLDVYIDDYSKPDPLPPQILAQLKHGQQILAWALEDTEKTAKEAAEAASAVRSPALIQAQQSIDSTVQPEIEPAREMKHVEPR